MAALEVPKQEAFAQQYLVDFNAQAAALRAGYQNGKQGYDLLQLDEVRHRVGELIDERNRRLQLDQDYVVRNLQEIVNRCMELEPVTEKGQLVLDTDSFGDVRAVVKFDARGATAALQLLGKHVGMFVDRVEHSGEVATREMSDTEIARRVAHILQTAMNNRGASTSPQQQQISNRSLQ